MTINFFLDTFAGLPVVQWDEEVDPADPAAVAWRIDMEYDTPQRKLLAAFEHVLRRCGAAGPTALIFGSWGEPFEDPFPFDLLIRNTARLSGLRALFVGEMGSEQCEISWIVQDDYAPVLQAFPALERLWIRGAQKLALTPLRHESLRELVIQSGGLPTSVIQQILACDLPQLEHLELWLGVDNYGGDATVEDLAPLLSGRLFPTLTRLGLCNAEIVEQLATAVAAAPIVARLKALDLSYGVFGDAGAEALLAGQPLTHLDELRITTTSCPPRWRTGWSTSCRVSPSTSPTGRTSRGGAGTPSRRNDAARRRRQPGEPPGHPVHRRGPAVRAARARGLPVARRADRGPGPRAGHGGARRLARRER
ncbi:hypothetical protein GCM10025331_42110 [Actinoplanes utahensis]|nr:hypothetical protein Aut01nite_02040 [Actinoplanes utahensis]